MNKIFEKNMGIKIFSLLFSFFLWFYVMAVVDPIDTKDILISNIHFSYEGADENEFTPIGSLPSVRLRVRGKNSDISKITPDTFSLNGIISNPKVGANRAVLKAELPTRVTYEIVPGDIYIELDKLKVQSRTVEIVTVNSLPEDREVKVIDSNVKATYIEGPQSQLDKVDKVIAKVDLSGQEEDFSQKINLLTIDDNGKEVANVTLNTEYVFIRVVINHKKTVDVLPNIIDTHNEGVLLSAYKAVPDKVTVSGTKSRIDSIKGIYTQLINSSELQGRLDKKIKLDIPPGITTNVNEVILKRSAENLIEKTFVLSAAKIDLRNFSHEEEEFLRSEIPDITYSVSISKEFEDELEESNIVLSMDKEKMDEGTLRIPILLETELPIDEYNIEPQSVTFSYNSDSVLQ